MADPSRLCGVDWKAARKMEKARFTVGPVPNIRLRVRRNISMECARMQSFLEQSGSRLRRVTYQIVLCGIDGSVIASDKHELNESGVGSTGHGFNVNMLRKLHIDTTGCLAWAFSGGPTSRVAAAYLEGLMNESSDRSIGSVKAAMIEAGNAAWRASATGPQRSTILLLDGRSKTALRADVSASTFVEELATDHPIFAGQHFSPANLFPMRYYASEMSVSSLAFMGACAVRMAHDFDPVMVDGLDVAIYRDSRSIFEFADSRQLTRLWNAPDLLDESVRNCINAFTWDQSDS
jgi:hypothetical protein